LQKSFDDIVEGLKLNNTDGIILASTELSIFRNSNKGVCIVDSNYELAKYTVAVALGITAIQFDTRAVLRFWNERAQLLKEGKVTGYQATMFVNDKKKAEEKDKIEKLKVLEAVDHFKDFGKNNALDIGCGIGRWSEFFSKYFEHIEAIDYCEEFINIAKANSMNKGVTNIQYSVASIDNIKTNVKYDSIFSFGLFNYLNDDMVKKLVRKIAHSLKPGAHCVLRETLGVTKRMELHGYYSESLKTEYRSIYRTVEEIVSLFGKHNMKMISKNIYTQPTQEKPETCQMVMICQK